MKGNGKIFLSFCLNAYVVDVASRVQKLTGFKKAQVVPLRLINRLLG